ncbi:MAG: DUF892 family protein [Fibrobacter sp.]|nr:DUF892 family protein [Fibrobacter sp.]
MLFNTLQDLYIDSLNDLYTSEMRIAEHLAAVIKADSASTVTEEVSQMYNESSNSRALLEKFFKDQHLKPLGRKNTVINALIQKSIEHLQFCTNPELKGSALVASLQCIMHYQIACYGSAATYAKTLGLENFSEALHTIVQEKKRFDVALSEIAEKGAHGAAPNTRAA